MKKILILITLICFCFLGSSVVFADTSATPTPTSQPIHASQCTYLKITSGNKTQAPANISFEAKAEDNQGNISTYHFYFGDGEKAEVMSDNVSHTYTNSGSYTARVYARDTKGNLVTSSACEAQVTVDANTVESHRSDCSDVFFESGNNLKAPSTLRVRVNGFDNKGSLQGYRVDFGSDDVQESTTSAIFEHEYQDPGTFPVKAYVKDSQGEWVGGDDSCRKDVSILTEDLKEQPKTGVPILLALGMAGMGGSGVVLQLRQKKINQS